MNEISLVLTQPEDSESEEGEHTEPEAGTEEEHSETGDAEHAEEGAGHEEEGPNGFWLPHDMNEVYWGSAAFVIVAFLLVKLGAKPVAAFFSGRSQRIAEELSAAADARQAALAERDRVAATLAGQDDEADRILAEARETATRLKADLIARADADAAALRERAVTDIESARRQAMSDLSAEIATLSLGATEAVVESSLDPATQQALIEAYISKVGA